MSSLPELSTLRGELRTAGVFEHSELRSWLKLGFMLAVVVTGLVAIQQYGFWMAVPAVPVLAAFCTAIAMFGHEGSHRSFSSSPTRNAIIAYFAFPLFGGLSSLYWREKHDRLHHGHPNVEGVDPDIRPFPFASSRADHERCGPKERWFQRHLQAKLFWPMSTLMALGMRRSSLVHLFRYPKKSGFDRAWWTEAACLAVHYTGWLVIPSLIWGPLVGFGVYSAIWAGVGVCLSLVFAPAHIGLPVTNGQNHDWLHQLETTRNLEMPGVLSFFFIGLDHQVEHHLFPKIPHKHLPRAAAITRAWCERHGIPYFSEPYLHALRDAARYMARGWQTDSVDPMEVRAGLVGATPTTSNRLAA